ncbi:hypothetical protein LZ023_31040 [Pseudomonas silvicola]|nr:hypothetical protein LZ023_31040 [Pseudomonas silvicola]
MKGFIKAIASVSGLVCAVAAGAAHATTVTVTIINHSADTIAWKTGTNGLPTVIGGGQPTSQTINFNNSGSTVRATYAKVNGQACTFVATHKLITSGSTLIPQFDKSATSSGTVSATCTANLVDVKYVAPYNYTAKFEMY